MNPCAILSLLLCTSLLAPAAHAQSAGDRFQPFVGQEGKDVVWVPTPPALVEKMLDMARVTPRDYVVDLGSGDGRNIIAAAKRGARGLGVEFNPEMVELSRRVAAEEGVADKAKFVQGDMFKADISQATVLALFLLHDNLLKLTPKFLALRPGTRIVTNGFEIAGWRAEEVGRADGDCMTWCTAYLYIVPAKVAGTWRLPEGTLKLEQHFQAVSGTLVSQGVPLAVSNGRLKGDRISFTVGKTQYAGRVNGNSMSGSLGGNSAQRWNATRVRLSQSD